MAPPGDTTTIELPPPMPASAPPPPRVEFAGVRKVFRQGAREVVAVEDLSFTVENQKFVSIIGPSGCGKSTALKLLSGLDRPTSGRVLVDGVEVDGPQPKVAFMLQKDLLLPWRTVLGNVMLGLELKGLSAAARRERAMALIQKVGLDGFEDSYPKHLSGGMRQRVALARTLAVDPEILLLDEPLSALDYQTKLRMEEELVRILSEERKTVLLITHDIAEAVSVSDKVLVCSGRPGRIKAGHEIPLAKFHSPEAARNNPDFVRYFDLLWKELKSDVAF
jgi:NitT/TauT family transport system ATP-binding protein